MKAILEFTDEDATYDVMTALNNFKANNVHPSHRNDIDKVSYEKTGDCTITLVSKSSEAIVYVAGYASETDLDRYRGVRYVPDTENVAHL